MSLSARPSSADPRTPVTDRAPVTDRTTVPDHPAVHRGDDLALDPVERAVGEVDHPDLFHRLGHELVVAGGESAPPAAMGVAAHLHDLQGGDGKVARHRVLLRHVRHPPTHPGQRPPQ